MVDLTSISYGVSLAAAALFGIFALLVALLRRRVQKDTTESFLTARGSASELIIAASLFSATMGAWAVFSMASYVAYAGIVGLVFYAIACGFPLVFIAYMGCIIRNRYPHILSLGDFVHSRYGNLVRWYVSALLVFNMAIALTAEYTAIGNLFEYVIGGSRIPIVVAIASVTSLYTAVGGLYVSMITDCAQTCFTISLLLVVYIYVAITFRPGPLPPLNDVLGPQYWGYASIAAMPIANTTAGVFVEYYWQLVWASKNDRALKRGTLWAATGITVFCFLFGFGGFLAIWANYPQSSLDGSTAFFDLLSAGASTTPIWIIVVVGAITVIMAESTVDSLQNGITDTLTAVFFRRQPVWIVRTLAFLINVPLVLVSLYGLNINSIFLIGNMLCTISTIPVLVGLWERADGYITSGACLFGCLFGFWSVVVFGVLKTGTLYDGLQYTFFLYYDWPQFVIGLVFSAIGVASWVVGEAIFRITVGWQWPLPKSRYTEELERIRTQSAGGKSNSDDSSKPSTHLHTVEKGRDGHIQKQVDTEKQADTKQEDITEK